MLVVRSLSKCFDQKPVLSDFNLTVHPGEIVFLSGPSGVGKSTVLRAIANLNLCDTGEVLLDGQTPNSLGFAQWRRDVMYVPQTRLSYNCTPQELFTRTLSFKSRSSQTAEIEDLLECYMQICVAMGLERRNIMNQKWTELSGGQAQRATAALCIALQPKVLLLDEPSSSCDHQSALLVERAIIKSGITCVWVSHDAGQPGRVGGRIQEMRNVF